MSGRHALIGFQDGAYYLEDLSVNGVFVNGAREPVGKSRRVRLSNGDLLGIGDYVVAVELESAAPRRAEPLPVATSAGDPFAEADVRIPDDDWSLGGGQARVAPVAPSSARLLGKAEVDPLDLIGGRTAPSRPEPTPGSVADHVPSDQVQFTPPRAVPEAIPEDWDQTGRRKAPARPTAPAYPPSTDAAAPATLPEDWDLDESLARPRRPAVHEESVRPRRDPRPSPEPPAPAAPRAAASPGDLGGDGRVILEELVAGLMELLAARSTFKSEFRIDATMIRPVENNPLKFSASAKEALEHLLIPSGKAYLRPVEAVREGVQDVKDHALAMIAAMRAALESLLTRFDPDALEARFGERGKSLMGGKGRNWDMYRELFSELRRDPDALFRDVFGEEFVRAYEAQIALLAKARR